MPAPSSAELSLADLLLPDRAGRGSAAFMGGVLMTWDAVTYANTVRVGAALYTNLAVLNPAALPVGAQVAVLLARTGGAPVVLGPLVRFTPPDTSPEA